MARSIVVLLTCAAVSACGSKPAEIVEEPPAAAKPVPNPADVNTGLTPGRFALSVVAGPAREASTIEQNYALAAFGANTEWQFLLINGGDQDIHNISLTVENDPAFTVSPAKIEVLTGRASKSVGLLPIIVISVEHNQSNILAMGEHAPKLRVQGETTDGVTSLNVSLSATALVADFEMQSLSGDTISKYLRMPFTEFYCTPADDIVLRNTGNVDLNLPKLDGGTFRLAAMGTYDFSQGEIDMGITPVVEAPTKRGSTNIFARGTYLESCSTKCQPRGATSCIH